MKQTRETSAIFGLRYLEEEDPEINDIVGCLTVVANPPGNTYEYTYYTTGSDVVDYDSPQWDHEPE
jgi:hypothetical protein